jgi:hypothetical protein
MKKLVEISSENHLESYLGETLTVFACRYIYSGKLVSIDETSICLEDAGIVYETGELTDKQWKDRQALPHKWCIERGSIESFGVLK